MLDLMGIVVFVSCILINVIAWYYVTPPKMVARQFVHHRYLGKSYYPAERLAFFGFMGVILLLYAELFSIGVYPFVECIERYEYMRLEGAILQRAIVKYGFLFSLTMGLLTFFPAIHGDKLRLRFLWLLVPLFTYFLITGHRFSIFFNTFVFFFAPFGILIFRKFSSGLIKTDVANNLKLSRGTLSSFSAVLILCALIPLIGIANSYLNVRADSTQCSFKVSKVVSNLATYIETEISLNENLVQEETLLSESNSVSLEQIRSAGEAVLQRIVLQPVEIYLATWERLNTQPERYTFQTLLRLKELRDSDIKNSGITLLMERSLTEERISYLKSIDVQFAGGYPEILIEIGGVKFLFLLVIPFALLSAVLGRIFILSVIRGNLFSAIMAMYVLYGVFVFFISGFIEFALSITYIAKVAILAFSLKFESQLYKRFGIFVLDAPVSKRVTKAI